MSKTEYLELDVVESSSEKVEAWWKAMSDATNSNMTKIDQAVSEKAGRSDSLELLLPASAWEGENAPYTQKLLINGLQEDQNGGISMSSAATEEVRLCTRNALLSIVEQTDGALTIVADGLKPQMDIPVSVVLLS